MTDAEAYDVLVDTQGIIDAVRVVARFNRPMETLARNLEAFTPRAAGARGACVNAVQSGSTLFETLAKVEPQLADAIHDFVYQVSNPHSSIITKNLAREEVCEVVLELA